MIRRTLVDEGLPLRTADGLAVQSGRGANLAREVQGIVRQLVERHRCVLVRLPRQRETK